MKFTALASAISLLLLAPVASAQPTQDQTQQGQAGINLKACEQAKKADKELSAIYGAIIKKYDFDKMFLRYMEESQKAWLAYREAHLKAIYPSEYLAAYGSAISDCVCAQRTRLTKERIKELNQWVEGTYEGNICAGTILKTRLAPATAKPE